MKFKEMENVMDQVFVECQTLRDAGQKEYAGEGADCFDNFNRLQLQLRLDRKQVLMVYAMKHLDGITSFIHGHKSQREDVRGRINDLIVYLVLLRGMIDEEALSPEAKYVKELGGALFKGADIEFEQGQVIMRDTAGKIVATKTSVEDRALYHLSDDPKLAKVQREILDQYSAEELKDLSERKHGKR